ncbi:hypothetical protein H5410_036868 [Solanum commersonii]|uniref:Uncharacterized protein n=1 Tax=Solanum commersonii TaxID=4109 RepID=A0A9J5Y8M5_SOLCO|nr:hypothetical protein H5410_036868 [Solanum commersonii]
MICQSTVQPKKHRKFPRGSTGKVRYLHVEEKVGLPSGIEKYGSPLLNIVSSRVVPTESMAIVTQGHFSNSCVQISNSFPEKSAVQRSLGSAGYTKPHNLKIANITKQSQKIKFHFLSYTFVLSFNGCNLFLGPTGSTILDHRSPATVNEN